MVEELSSKVAKTEGENENLREELFNTEVKLENMQQKFPDFYIHRTWASFLSSGKLTKSDCPNLKYILKVIIKSLDIDKNSNYDLFNSFVLHLADLPPAKES